MAIFNSYVNVHQAGYLIYPNLPIKTGDVHNFFRETIAKCDRAPAQSKL